MPQPSTFKFFVPFNKAYIDKSTNKMVVEGLASTTEVDLTGEKMAESAIKSMAQSNLPLSFRSEHKDDWDAELGQVVELSATTDHQLLMKAELDADHPNAHFLFGKLQKGSQLGLSIGGQVNDWGWEHDEQIGRSIRTYKDIALKEVSVTSHPAVASTFLAAINKSLTSQESPAQKATELEKAAVSATTIYDALVKVYPKDVLGWVKDATWTKDDAVSLSTIDMARRPGGRDQKKVEGIAQAIADGKEMDPVVLVNDGTDKLQIADGYHRTLAFEHAGKKTIPAYIGSGLEPGGPWEKDMHEAKLNKNTQSDTVAAPVNLEPADDVIVEQTPETPSSTDVVNPIPATAGEPVFTNEEGLPLNPDQPAPADQPAAAPEVPSTPGNHATDEQVEELESDQPTNTQEGAQDATEKQPGTTDEGDAGHQEASSTEETQPDAATTEGTDAEIVPASVPEETHKALQLTCDDLQKSLSAVNDELATVTKRLEEQTAALDEKAAALETVKTEKDAIETELATTKESLTKAQTDLQAEQSKAQVEKNRKAAVVAEKFDLALKLNKKESPQDLNTAFASFITGGK